MVSRSGNVGSTGTAFSELFFRFYFRNALTSLGFKVQVLGQEAVQRFLSDSKVSIVTVSAFCSFNKST